MWFTWDFTVLDPVNLLETIGEGTEVELDLCDLLVGMDELEAAIEEFKRVNNDPPLYIADESVVVDLTKEHKEYVLILLPA